jgi:hypothetical protein
VTTTDPAPEPMPIKHLSHSSRSLVSDCAKKWEFKYIHRLPEEPALPMQIGSANHAVLESINRHIKDVKTEPDRVFFRKKAEEIVKMSLPLEAFSEVKPKSKAEEGMSKEAFLANQQENTIRQLQDMAVIYIDTACANFKEVLLVEEGILADIGGVPYQMYIDVVVRTKALQLKVLDFKTKGQSGGEPDILQLVSYDYGVEALLKESSHGLEQWNFIKKAKPDLEIQPVDMLRIGELKTVLVEEIRAAWQLIKTRMFLRNTRSMFCGKGKCDFWDACMNPSEFAERRTTTADFHKGLVEGLEHRR